ncbi:MAG: DUF2303 family protein [Pseudomonadota bacterium]
MTMDKSAIQQIQQAEATTQARNTLNEFATPVPIAALPDNMKLHNLEHYLDGRVRFRGELETISIDDFIAYCSVNVTAGASCFIDPERMSAKAYLNLGTAHEPGHGDHTAQLELKKTAPYRALLDVDHLKLGQKKLAEWIEEWREFVTPFDSEGNVIDPVRAVAAIRRIKINGNSEAEHNVQDFRASRSKLESVEAKSDHGMPAAFWFRCEPYQGLERRTFHVRLSLLTGGDEPVLVPRIQRAELEQQEMADELAKRLTEQLEQIDTYTGVFTL